MSVVRIKSTKSPPESYICKTSDAKETWPFTCGAGSEMTVVNDTTHEVDSFYIFDGADWNAL